MFSHETNKNIPLTAQDIFILLQATNNNATTTATNNKKTILNFLHNEGNT